jgi:hypothetical protein
MKRSMPVLLALTIGCATGAVVRDVAIVAPARAQGQTGPSYEYEVIPVAEFSVTTKRKEVVAKYGREGWRLTAATVTEGGWTTLYFERLLPR